MNRRALREDGFTILELLVATAIALGLTAALLNIAHASRGLFQSQPERADMLQRLRVSIDALTKDLLMAGSGMRTFDIAPVMPYRVGARDSDVDLGISYRQDAISVRYVPQGESVVASHTYHLRRDPATRTLQLMHYDGASTDLPVADHVVGLQFEYFDDTSLPLDPAVLQDGPWLPDDTDPDAFDANLLDIRRVRVLVRVEASLASMRGPAGILFTHAGTSTAAERFLPDLELRFDVALRNMEGEPGNMSGAQPLKTQNQDSKLKP